jgi:hypothetical protein
LLTAALPEEYTFWNLLVASSMFSLIPVMAEDFGARNQKNLHPSVRYKDVLVVTFTW